MASRKSVRSHCYCCCWSQLELVLDLDLDLVSVPPVGPPRCDPNQSSGPTTAWSCLRTTAWRQGCWQLISMHRDCQCCCCGAGLHPCRRGGGTSSRALSAARLPAGELQLAQDARGRCAMQMTSQWTRQSRRRCYPSSCVHCRCLCADSKLPSLPSLCFFIAARLHERTPFATHAHATRR